MWFFNNFKITFRGSIWLKQLVLCKFYQHCSCSFYASCVSTPLKQHMKGYYYKYRDLVTLRCSSRFSIASRSFFCLYRVVPSMIILLSFSFRFRSANNGSLANILPLQSKQGPTYCTSTKYTQISLTYCWTECFLTYNYIKTVIIIFILRQRMKNARILHRYKLYYLINLMVC